MALKVLIVDDSSFFRRRVTEIINNDPDMEVIGSAVNGKEAVEKAISLRPDVITMDVEMPVMDGITAVREIMKAAPTSILMFSSLTHQGAKATLDALDAGALDFLPKKFEDIARDKNEAVETLQARVKAIARKPLGRSAVRQSAAPVRRPAVASDEQTPILSSTAKPRFAAKTADRQSNAVPSSRSTLDASRNLRKPASVATPQPTNPRVPSRATSQAAAQRAQPRAAPAPPTEAAPVVGSPRSNRSRAGEFKLLAIGTSTGGPVALQTILTSLPQNYPYPILLIQHMPATFTAAFAARLNTLCKIGVKEAADGDVLKPGMAYLAPGGKQMLIDGSETSARLKIRADDSARITYKPSVDITFGSAAKVFRDKVLAVILTGMGADGREGARMLKKFGSTIWAQDEQSCVVYGMPQAVAVAGISEADIALKDMASRITKESGYG
ncbi:MAG: two-component system chemotaxis response regulator CheB [Phenylobacterium sp.]|jgi:two-component system chemotaxis response regulator CheB